MWYAVVGEWAVMVGMARAVGVGMSMKKKAARKRPARIIKDYGNCGECLMRAAQVIKLCNTGMCRCCGADYGQIAPANPVSA